MSFLQPVEDRRRVRAILPYTKVPDTDEIRYIFYGYPPGYSLYCSYENIEKSQ